MTVNRLEGVGNTSPGLILELWIGTDYIYVCKLWELKFWRESLGISEGEIFLNCKTDWEIKLQRKLKLITEMNLLIKIYLQISTLKGRKTFSYTMWKNYRLFT